jgi:hypothetical protein
MIQILEEVHIPSKMEEKIEIEKSDCFPPVARIEWLFSASHPSVKEQEKCNMIVWQISINFLCFNGMA